MSDSIVLDSLRREGGVVEDGDCAYQDFNMTVTIVYDKTIPLYYLNDCNGSTIEKIEVRDMPYKWRRLFEKDMKQMPEKESQIFSGRKLCERMASHIYQFNEYAVSEAESLEDLEDMEYLRGQIELLGDTLLYTAGADELDDLASVKKAVYEAFTTCDGDEKKFVTAVSLAFFGAHDSKRM